MRVVVQRVESGRVLVAGHVIAAIGRGLVLFVGVGLADTDEQVRFLVEKVANLRIFEDELGKMNLSVLDIAGEVLVVSQFTLYADTHRGRRPSFTAAASPEVARPLVEHFASLLRQLGIPTQTGEFAAHMLVEINNDGPVTLWLDV
jgi:D-tyrosyl-tRNA(Tyr) deacylase